MSRPKSADPKVQKSVRLPASLWKKIETAARKQHFSSVPEFLRVTLSKALSGGRG